LRVLIVNKFLYPNGGSETYILKLGDALIKKGHSVEYFGMQHEGNVVFNSAGYYTEDMSFKGDGGFSKKIKKLTYPFKIIYSFDAKKKIRKVLDDFKPDVVHLNNINFQLTPSIIDEIDDYRNKKNKNLKIVMTVHDSQLVCPDHLMRIPSSGELCQRCIDGKSINCIKNKCIHNSRLQSIIAAFESYFYRHRDTYGKIDIVIAPSDFINDIVSHNKWIKGKTITLRNFMDMPKKKDAIEENAQNRSGLDKKVIDIISKNTPYVLYFGRYDIEKGIKTMISVASRLPEVDFVFAGKGEFESDVNALSNAVNVGFQDSININELIRHSRFTVFPSECYENAPFSVMESEINGAPIIASNLGGIPELIIDGETGELFEAGNDIQLEEKIWKLWNDDELISKYKAACAKISENKSLLKFMNIDEYVEKIEEIYKGKN